ncbi:hypothetical protein [Halosegnis sp.]|uniref:hypothetical protein n=1 Tax=Halosegnis sp. TaxID=2864959 RepID=UPI0035D472AE
MAAESEGEPLSVHLPPDLEAWLDNQASEHGMNREQLLGRLLEATRLALTEADADYTDVDDIAARVDALDEELDEKIDDVRSRVIQVKQEADAKAPADHNHVEFDRIDGVEDAVAELDESVSAIEAGLADLEADIEGHDDRLETLEGRLRQVASAVVQLKRAVGGGDDDRLAELKRTAARRGFRSADCDACGESVDIGMLTESACPYCDMDFGDLTGESGLFSTPKLLGEE